MPEDESSSSSEEPSSSSEEPSSSSEESSSSSEESSSSSEESSSSSEESSSSSEESSSSSEESSSSSEEPSSSSEESSSSSEEPSSSSEESSSSSEESSSSSEESSSSSEESSSSSEESSSSSATEPGYPPEPPEKKPPCQSGYDSCDENCDDSEDPTNSEEDCEENTTSANPVRYASGQLEFVEHDLHANGFGLPWGHSRSYANILSDNNAGLNGNSWLVREWKALLFVDVSFGNNDPQKICIVDGGNSSLWFVRQSPGVYRAQFGEVDTLVQRGDGADGEFVWTDRRGGQTLFFDNSFSQPSERAGRLKAVIDPGGRRVDATYDESGQLIEFGQAADGQSSRFIYAYPAGLLASITLLVDDRPVRRATYGYYTGESGGNVADLKSSTIEQYDPGTTSWRTFEHRHYRYYAGESGGFVHGLKFAIRGAAYQRMLEAGLDPQTAPVSELEQYADYYFEYDSDQRVSRETIEGGRKTYTYTYEANPTSPTPVNLWSTRTIETLPDGSQNRVYSNQAGQTLLHILRSASGAQWCRYSQFDSAFHLILQASPAAIASVSEPTLPANPTLTVTLKTNEGLIREQVFYPTTNLGTGAVAGRLDKVLVRKGTGGTPIVLRHVEYTFQTAFGQTIYPVRAEEVYPGETTANPARTTYDYTWQVDQAGAQTFQILEKTVSYPAVPTTQNGSGIAGIERTVFDRFGQPIWQRDSRGAITYRAYDVATGALVQRIDDVDTTRMTNVPPGWSTVPGWGQHLISDFLNDSLGRPVQARGPWHEVQLREKDTALTPIRRVQFTAYLDDAHEVRQATGYQAGQSPTAEFMTVGAVRLTRTDESGRVTDEIQAVRTCSCGPLTTEESFPQEKWSRWTHSIYDTWGRLYARRVYHRIPAQGEGEAGANYLETINGYDVMGRRDRTLEASGTIRRLVHDPRGLVLANWTGTDDRGATPTDPSGSGTAGNNMKLVSAQEYDGGAAGGNGNLTRVTQPVDPTAANDRITTYAYDFRDRRETTTQTDGTMTWVTAVTYDNLDRPLQNSTSISGGPLIARGRSFYDLLGRVYRQETDGVDPSSGSIAGILTGQSWYDLGTNVIKASQAGNTAFTKTVFDALNRPTVSYVACRPATAGVPEGDDNNVSSDTVLEQNETTYDRAGNVLQATRRQRFDDETMAGPLKNVSTQPKARVSYTALWPDAIGRVRVTADYGTFGAVPFVRPALAPARSDTVLVTTNRFKDNGDANAVVDPEGLETRWENDQAGRRVKLIENYVEGAPERSRTSAYTWHASEQLERLILSNSETGEQVTRWVYGTTLTESQVSDNNLLRAKIYPESDDRPAPLDAGPDGVYARLEYTYNRQGQSTQFKDADGTVHRYTYDKLGRLVSDAVSDPSPQVDGAVLRIQRAYEVRGMLAKVTSYDAADGGLVVNESAFTYDAFGNLTLDQQSHSGIVTGATPAVAYTYANASANTVRRTSTVYPDGKVLQVFYGSTHSIDDHLSRVSKLQFQGEPIPLVEYSYVGVAWQVRVGYAGPAVELTYKSEHSGDAGDPYNGYDRFGRAQDIRWQSTGT